MPALLPLAFALLLGLTQEEVTPEDLEALETDDGLSYVDEEEPFAWEPYSPCPDIPFPSTYQSVNHWIADTTVRTGAGKGRPRGEAERSLIHVLSGDSLIMEYQHLTIAGEDSVPEPFAEDFHHLCRYGCSGDSLVMRCRVDAPIGDNFRIKFIYRTSPGTLFGFKDGELFTRRKKVLPVPDIDP